MAWTNIPAYVLDKVFGYQSANQLRENDIALAAVPYIVKSKTTPLSDFLSAAQPLDALGSGYVKNTTGTGVLSVVPTIPSTDITGTIPATAHHAAHETGGADAIAVLDAGVLTAGTVAMARLPTNIKRANIYFHIANFASAGAGIATGVAGFWAVPWAGTIIQVTLLSIDPDVTSGSIVVDIWKDSYASFPPTVADSICASAKPTLTSGIKYQDTVLTGWTTTLVPGDVLGFNVDSVSAVKHVLVELRVTLT